MSGKDSTDQEPIGGGSTPGSAAVPAASELQIYPWMRRVHSGHGKTVLFKHKTLLAFFMLYNIRRYINKERIVAML